MACYERPAHENVVLQPWIFLDGMSRVEEPRRNLNVDQVEGLRSHDQPRQS